MPTGTLTRFQERLLAAVVTATISAIVLAALGWLGSSQISHGTIQERAADIMFAEGYYLSGVVAMVCLIWWLVSPSARQTWQVKACLITAIAVVVLPILRLFVR